MNQGRKVADGSIADLRRWPPSGRAFAALPGSAAVQGRTGPAGVGPRTCWNCPARKARSRPPAAQPASSARDIEIVRPSLDDLYAAFQRGGPADATGADHRRQGNRATACATAGCSRPRLLLAALALTLAFLGAAPTGTVKVSALAVTIVSLSSLTIFLRAADRAAAVLRRHRRRGRSRHDGAAAGLSGGALAGDARQVRSATSAFLASPRSSATASAGVALWLGGDDRSGAWRAFAVMMASSVLLGGVLHRHRLFREHAGARPRHGRRHRHRRLAVLRAALRHGVARRAGGRPGPHGDGANA